MKKSVTSRIITAWFLALSMTALVGCASTQEEADDAQPTKVSKSASGNDSYTVVGGDHLWGISSQSRIYGNPYQWPLIYKANSNKIEDADLIEPGQVFVINRNASSGDVEVAVHHAKTRGAWSIGVTESSDKAYLRR